MKLKLLKMAKKMNDYDNMFTYEVHINECLFIVDIRFFWEKYTLDDYRYKHSYYNKDTNEKKIIKGHELYAKWDKDLKQIFTMFSRYIKNNNICEHYKEEYERIVKYNQEEAGISLRKLCKTNIRVYRDMEDIEKNINKLPPHIIEELDTYITKRNK
jgi:hypothetical protein